MNKQIDLFRAFCATLFVCKLATAIHFSFQFFLFSYLQLGNATLCNFVSCNKCWKLHKVASYKVGRGTVQSSQKQICAVLQQYTRLARIAPQITKTTEKDNVKANVRVLNN